MSASALRNRLTTVLLVASVLALARALWPEGSERTAALYVVVLTLGYGHLFGAALLGRGNRGLRARGVSTWLRFSVFIVALGTVAHRATLKALGLRLSAFPFGHGAEHPLDDGLRLIDSYHCSRYNTQTRRLTAVMFEDIFRAVQQHLAP
jgi:hypothetical protein